MRCAIAGAVLILAGCGGATERASGWSGPPPEVVKEMTVPPSPYYIIYSPAVDLAKRK